MKKIIIVPHSLEIGGAEKALLGLLENLDYKDVEVDLFLFRHQGELFEYIPKHICLLPQSEYYSCMAIPLIDVLKRGKIRIAIGRLIGKILAKNKIKQFKQSDSDIELEYSHKYTVDQMPMISYKHYDLAISFLTPHYYVTDKVIAKKKVAWIHTDYSQVGIDRESQLKMWNNYDVICSISDDVTHTFIDIFPELKSKIKVIGNIMPKKYIEVPEDKKIIITDGISNIKKFNSRKYEKICNKLNDNIRLIFSD